jgi:hypothetical protein
LCIILDFPALRGVSTGHDAGGVPAIRKCRNIVLKFAVSVRDEMQEWLPNLSKSVIEHAGTWFVGLVLAVLGVFSDRIVGRLRFALNRADLRAKCYEEMAESISHFVFLIDRMVNVYYGSTWVTDKGKSAIASEYDAITNEIMRKEYVYQSWMKRYWGKETNDAFRSTMAIVKHVDAVLRELNDRPQDKTLLDQLGSAFCDLQRTTERLLTSK